MIHERRDIKCGLFWRICVWRIDQTDRIKVHATWWPQYLWAARSDSWPFWWEECTWVVSIKRDDGDWMVREFDEHIPAHAIAICHRVRSVCVWAVDWVSQLWKWYDPLWERAVFFRSIGLCRAYQTIQKNVSDHYAPVVGDASTKAMPSRSLLFPVSFSYVGQCLSAFVLRFHGQCITYPIGFDCLGMRRNGTAKCCVWRHKYEALFFGAR